MKKIFYVAATAAMLASCSTDFDLSEVFGSGGTSETIGFQVQKGNNVTRATSLQNAGHYNFGVFGYKVSDLVNPIFPDYLVGYFDDNLGYQKVGTTWGDKDGVEDGKSYWMYEGLGNEEYFGTYAGQALTRFYQSNNAKQYLKYWDKSAEYTCFYAYAPYVGTETTTERVTYVDGVAQKATGSDTYVLNIPDGTLVAGYDDPTKYEFMYASKKVSADNYGHDVSLDFKRLVAKVNIKFWEDIPGYKVRIIGLKEGKDSVYAAAAIHKNSDTGVDPTPTYKPYGYRAGKYYTKNGVKIKFNSNTAAADKILQYVGTTATNTTPLQFAVPTESEIGTNRYMAAKSATDYYAIPKGINQRVLKSKDGETIKYENFPANPDGTEWGDVADADLAKTGFTFHVSYELTAEDSGERIVVRNATVHVPYNYCNWEANTHYTYIFKITKNSNGSTDTDPTIDPTDPDVPTDQALYPIVFDNCTVQDWDENESEWEITDGTELSYHNISLTVPQNSEGQENATKPCYSITNGTATKLTVKISDADKHNNHAVDYSAKHNLASEGSEPKYSGVEVTGPTGATTTDWYKYTADNKYATIEVPAGAQEGVYTVTYYCPDSDINRNHPTTWTTKFYVGQAYTISTTHEYVGTGFTETSISLGITGTKTGTDSYTLVHDGLSIDYPKNFTSDQKKLVKIDDTENNPENKVVINKDAVPGTYKVVYTVKIDGVDVKVAETTFEVIDFNFTLNPTVVYNNGSDQTVTCSQAYEDGKRTYSVASSSGSGVSVDGNSNKIKVTSAAADNATHTITYTVWSDGSSATYTNTFKTANSHSVAISKTSIDRDYGTNTGVEAGTTDFITVTTKQNGADTDTNLTSKLSVVQLNAKGEEVTTNSGKFTITYDGNSGNSYTLKCKNNTPVGNYYVKYVDTVLGTNKTEYSPAFVVTK